MMRLITRLSILLITAYATSTYAHVDTELHVHQEITEVTAVISIVSLIAVGFAVFRLLNKSE